MKKIRNTNIEILRIISMIMIVLSHFTVHNTVKNYLLPFGLNRLVLEWSTLGNIGVILFVLITGYYSFNKKNSFKLKRLFSITFQTFFYAMSIYLIFVLCGWEKFAPLGFISNLFPIIFKKYWFMTAFVVLYIFMPYINRLIEALDRREHLRFIIVSLLLFSIIPMLTTKNMFGNEIVQFLMFYMIGAYLGKYKDNYFNNKKHCYSVLIVSALVLFGSVVVVDLLGSRFGVLAEHSTYLFARNSIVSIAFATSLFSAFALRKPFTNNIVNSVAACTLGVYLISDNPLIRHVLWSDWLNVPGVVDKPILILHMFACVFLVFIGCVVIEFVRQNTVERFFSISYDAVEKKIIAKKNG